MSISGSFSSYSTTLLSSSTQLAPVALSMFQLSEALTAFSGINATRTFVRVDTTDTIPLPTQNLQSPTWESLCSYLAALNWWNLLLYLLVASNLRHIPFVYHLRILNAVRFVLRSQRPAIDIQPHQLFQPLITSSRSSLLDMDIYGHKVSEELIVGKHIFTLSRAIQPISSTSILQEHISSLPSSARGSRRSGVLRP